MNNNLILPKMFRSCIKNSTYSKIINGLPLFLKNGAFLTSGTFFSNSDNCLPMIL